MFGIGLFNAYGNLTIDFLGGTNAALLVAITIRFLVGIGWYRLFEKAGKKPIYAFVPFIGPYTAFRMVWDDFSLSFIFAATTIISFVNSVLADQPSDIITACGYINFIMLWLMSLLTANRFQVSMFLGFIYAGVPWLGALLLGFWPAGNYKGPWSSDPEADVNLTPQELKKKRKKEQKQAKAAAKK